MKKVILFLVFLAVLVGGYFFVSKYMRVQIGVFLGEIKSTTRGDLVVPITASGYIQPASVRRIKSKASGEITDTPSKLGARVKRGDLLVKLLDVDEKRSFDRASADFERGQIALATAEIRVRQAETSALKAAEAKLDQAKAKQRLAQSAYDFFQPQTRPSEEGGKPTISPREWDVYDTSKLEADALVKAAEADHAQAQTAILLAKEEVKTAKENVKSLQAARDDAEERLKETNIISPVDGMVLSKPVQVGEISQGGKMTITGGTILVEIADISEIYAVVNVDEADIGQVHELAPVEARPGTATQPSARPVAASDREVADVPDVEPTTTGPAATLATLPAGTFEHEQVVKVKVESFPDEEFEGVITQISPQSEVVQAVATFKVWIRITSSNVNKLVGLLNTQTEAHFTAKSVRNAVLVQYDAVQKNPNGEGYGVYVPVPSAKPGVKAEEPKFVSCVFGADNGIDIEVRKGLTEGQRVYTKLPLKRDDQK